MFRQWVTLLQYAFLLSDGTKLPPAQQLLKW
jgi:hypothetical protein